MNPSRPRLIAAGFAIVPLQVAWLLGSPAFAQQAGASGQPDLVPVALWTFAVVCLAMFVLSLGYLYRRVRGATDEVIPKNVDPYYAVEGQIEKHGTTELHPEMAHDDVGLDAAERDHDAPHDHDSHAGLSGVEPVASGQGSGSSLGSAH
jgi:hypothetical protein